MTKKPQEQPKPHVCRRLFAEDEPREIGENRENRFVEDLHNQEVEDFIARYNFDPRTERPLPGNFEWYERRNSSGEWERMRLPGEQERQREQLQQQQQQQEEERETVREEGGEEQQQASQ